ncbi:DsbA family protein [Cupriavidus necator]|uniref:DsbA family protein n=1 Tax=Cupriavidus necator TaxID=106590 RepID=UPI00068EBA77|nr:DsbA family protein [Cupriavidus necator]
MHRFNLPPKSVVYVTDAYCGWCWGFSQRMGEFEAANRHKVAFSVISGGLFVGERAKSIASYPHIPQANERIAQMTGAAFGEAYQSLLRPGHTVMDSVDAAAGLAVLRAQVPERAVHWAHELQAAFYGRGLTLSDPETIAGIASANGLDEKLALRALADGSGKAQAKVDFELARGLGASSYPTLFFVDGKNVHKLPATGAALSTLNERLDALLA